MIKPHSFIVLACAALLPLSACDDAGDIRSNDRSGAPRGTFSSGANGMAGGGAPERRELERLRLDNPSQRPAPAASGGAPASSASASSNTTADRDLQSDTLTGRPSTP